MESIIEFFESNQRLVCTVIFVIILVVSYALIRSFARKVENLNPDLKKDEDESDETENEPEEEEPDGRFFIIEKYYLPDDWKEAFDIIVDRQTKVQYLIHEDYGITPLIDADGKPILYKEEEEDQVESE